jgi:hypothetical protein
LWIIIRKPWSQRDVQKNLQHLEEIGAKAVEISFKRWRNNLHHHARISTKRPQFMLIDYGVLIAKH